MHGREQSYTGQAAGTLALENLLNAEAAIADSARLILDEIGDPPDLTLVRGAGNRGDELIWAGTDQLLRDLIYYETDLNGLCGSTGHTVLLPGGGAFCRAFNDTMPRALAVACMRFARVILLPSSFDPSDDVVREALARTSATVFAREAESYRRIVSLCDARLAHDCAFFFDFEPWRRQGTGVLNAFRTDPEAIHIASLPHDNEDISATARSLDEWLEVIATHELVRTDRAHVMIAAALMGKRVEFAPSSYHKLPAMVEFALSGLPIQQIAPAPASPCAAVGTRSRRRPPSGTERVTAIILSRSRAHDALRAVDSLALSEVPTQTIVIDNNSSPADAELLTCGCEARPSTRLFRSDRNLGCAGGRRVGLAHGDSDYVLFLDDDGELETEALDVLVDELDSHPDVIGVTSTVVLPDGRIQHSGGWMRDSSEVAEFGLIAAGVPISEGPPPSGPADWIPGGAALFRRDVFTGFPIDPRMNAYFEDNEWCYRVERARPGSFRRSREARMVHQPVRHNIPAVGYLTRSRAVELLTAHAFFYRRHGKLLDGALFDLVPELNELHGGHDLAGARLLMELVDARGPDWTFMEWMNGGLERLLGAGRALSIAHAQLAECERTIERQQATVGFLQVCEEKLQRLEAGGWWRLRERLLPLLRLQARLRGTAQP